MSNPKFLADKNITLAKGDVIMINDLPVNDKLISVLTELLTRDHPEQNLYTIVSCFRAIFEDDKDTGNFSVDSCYILWYTAGLLKEYALLIRKKEGAVS